MKNIYVRDIIGIDNATLLCGDENIILDNFSKDTRTIKEGDIYLGIKGDNFDGNSFFEDALSKGAKACILDNINDIDLNKYQGKTIIKVDQIIVAKPAGGPNLTNNKYAKQSQNEAEEF